jgi:hypothetical protein
LSNAIESALNTTILACYTPIPTPGPPTQLIMFTSSGGFLSSARRWSKAWKKRTTPASLMFFYRRISFGLVKYRASLFVL